MSNVIEFVKGDRKVLLSKENMPLYGAVLCNLKGKASGVTRFAVLKDANVVKVLQASKITGEVQQVNEIGKCFQNLQLKGIISVSGEKVQTASLINDCAELAQEIIEQAGKIELPATTTAKRGRPAGTGAKSQGSTQVKRNPVKVQRFWLNDGKAIAFQRGKPSFAMLSQECDANGKIIADISKLKQPKAVGGKSMSVKRNPVEKANLRYYLLNGEVTPFGRGKPSFDKLNNECTQAGEKIDNSSVVAAMRQPKAGNAGNSSKIGALEAQIAQMAEMMKVMQQMMMGAAIPQQVQQVASVEVKVPETVIEKQAAPIAPAKAEKVKETKDKPAKATKAPKVEKVKNSRKVEKVETEDDAYEAYANISNDLGDDDPIAFGSDGFVVTEMDF